ncbi:carboxymuconolactone decarboxylase family protein [Clostridium botulinum]|uniref:Carboxymuconolactone decarboxylase family protein n=1 Tax=Clostridium botulinum TaxID=1491 RepID=A0A6B4UHC6_CLOBO|nr:carboxymuconolactone decarboxylase family protein [Clostridium botulinum]NFD85861.1 carboxymuconolactone decarboxylase family protein [Clostridium botulinum]NFE10415.1 carboxymuconolactone decarboxylase family protein [Clostridium botulinum]NFE36329.1 carboxymuconolactone decarboxylase family protein [Clostridium botulinum]NFE49343.1 carboxymuconolactone decarboxylase family protein [Clostridium botulinum]
MSESPKQMIEHLQKGAGKLASSSPQEMKALTDFVQSVLKEGALDLKTKEAIAIAISVYSRCPYCISAHVKNALAAGLTREQIIEAGTVAMAFGGGPAMAYSSTVLVDALNELEK